MLIFTKVYFLLFLTAPFGKPKYEGEIYSVLKAIFHALGT